MGSFFCLRLVGLSASAKAGVVACGRFLRFPRGRVWDPSGPQRCVWRFGLSPLGLSGALRECPLVACTPNYLRKLNGGLQPRGKPVKAWVHCVNHLSKFQSQAKGHVNVH